jgi:hypothetical protein
MRAIGGDFKGLLGAWVAEEEKVQVFDTINSESQASQGAAPLEIPARQIV